MCDPDSAADNWVRPVLGKEDSASPNFKNAEPTVGVPEPWSPLSSLKDFLDLGQGLADVSATSL